MRPARLALAFLVLTHAAACEPGPVEDEPVAAGRAALTVPDNRFDGNGKAYLHDIDGLAITDLWNKQGAPVYAGQLTLNGKTVMVGGAASTTGGMPDAGTYPYIFPVIVPSALSSQGTAVLKNGLPANKLTVAGFASYTGGVDKGVVARALPGNGGADPSFGDHGIATYTFGAQSARIHAMTADAQNRILVAGTAVYGDGRYVVVARLNATTGALDTTYGIQHLGYNGWKIPNGTSGYGVTGFTTRLLNNDVYVGLAGPTNYIVHFKDDGSFDSAFGSGGSARFGDAGGSGRLGALLAHPTGLLVGGNDDSNRMAFATFGYDGKPANVWNGGNTAYSDIADSDAESVTSLAMVNNRIYAGGWVSRGSHSYFAVLAFRSDRAIDNSFGQHGLVVTDFGADAVSQRAASVSIAFVDDRPLLMVGGMALGFDAQLKMHIHGAVARYIIPTTGAGEPCGSGCDQDLTCNSSTYTCEVDSLGYRISDSTPEPGQSITVHGYARARTTPPDGQSTIGNGQSCDPNDLSSTVFTDPCSCGHTCIDGVDADRARFAHIQTSIRERISNADELQLGEDVVAEPVPMVGGGQAVPFRFTYTMPASNAKPKNYYRWDDDSHDLRATFGVRDSGGALTERTRNETSLELHWKYAVKGSTETCVKYLDIQFDQVAADYDIVSRGAIDFRTEGRYPPGNDKFDDLGLMSHVQGFARMPGTNYFLGTRSWEPVQFDGEDFYPGVFLGKVDGLPADGLLGDGGASGRGALKEFYATKFTIHPGGIQAFKADGVQYVGTATECHYSDSLDGSTSCDGYATANIWQVNLPTASHAGSLQTVTWFDLLRFPLDSTSSASSLGVVRLSNGRFLMALGQRSKFVTLFESEEPWMATHTNDGWRQRNTVQPADGDYENFQLITDCDTGTIYGVGFMSEGSGAGSGRGHMTLHRFDPKPDGTWAVTKLETVYVADDDHCDLRGGGSIYVDPLKHTLSAYCADKTDFGHSGQITYKEFKVK